MTFDLGFLNLSVQAVERRDWASKSEDRSQSGRSCRKETRR